MSDNPIRQTFIDNFGYSLNVRSTTADVVLVSLGIGLAGCLIILYLIYLLVRILRKDNYIRSKADRPLWVLLVMISGLSWILTTLFYSGALVIEPEWYLGCSLSKFWGQYVFGYTLWSIAVLYRIIQRTWLQRSKNKPNAILLIFLLELPFLILAGVEIGLGRCFRDELDLCQIEGAWLIALYCLVVILLVIFLTSTVLLARWGGRGNLWKFNHEIIRYTIYFASSLLFPIFDAIGQAAGWNEELWAAQSMALLVMVIVTFNVIHIFVLILRVKQPMDMHNVNASLSSLGSQGIGEGPMMAIEDLAVIPAPDNSAQPIVLTRPRRMETEHVKPDFEQYIQAAGDDWAGRINKLTGYFRSSRKAQQTVIVVDTTKAQKFLGNKT